MSPADSFEYRTVDIDTTVMGFGDTEAPMEQLNELGADGWEVAAPITNERGETVSLLLQRRT